MKKLWKVTVNNWGWDAPKTKYFESRKDAEECAKQYPASDRVLYAGMFTDQNADVLTWKDKYEF